MKSLINPLLQSTTQLSDINESVINDFIESNLDENYTIELKTFTKDKDFNYNLRKAMAALANQQGGFIVIGIKDKKAVKDTTSVADRVVGHTLTEEIQKWVDNFCGQGTVVPRPRYEAAEVKAFKNLIVIKVYPYTLGPVGVKSRADGILEFWIRGNGSNLKMDYMALSDKFKSETSSMISAAFIDLSDTFRDAMKLQKNPLDLSGLNPIEIVSTFVEDRKIYYGLVDNDQKIVIHTNNLRRGITLVNSVISVTNNAHANGQTISNAKELSVQLTLYLSSVSVEILNIMSDLARIFPTIGQRFVDALVKEYNIDPSEFIEPDTD
jgi:hypothetical protein